MPNAVKKQMPSETFPAEEFDDDFGSLEDMAALMVEAFTLPMTSDLADASDEDSSDAKRTPGKPRN